VGSGAGHVETNYGTAFPRAWVYLQVPQLQQGRGYDKAYAYGKALPCAMGHGRVVWLHSCVQQGTCHARGV
jgi:hypothetical protein